MILGPRKHEARPFEPMMMANPRLLELQTPRDSSRNFPCSAWRGGGDDPKNRLEEKSWKGKSRFLIKNGCGRRGSG
jgi:hypothetical protein